MRQKNFTAVLVISVLLFLVGCMGPTESTSAMELTDKHLFTLNDLEGKPVSLSTALKQNKAVLINFWATWCPPCREEIPGLIKLQEQHASDGFTVLGVDVGESAKKASSFAKKMNINYPILLDDQMNVAQIYNVYGIPTSLLVNSQGHVLGVYHEFSEELVLAVEKALM